MFFFSPCYSPKLSSSPNLRKEEYVSGSLELLCKTLPRWQMALWSSSSYVAAMEKQAWGPSLCNEGSRTENSRSLGPWGHCRSAQEVMNWTDRPLYVFWVVIHVSFINPQKQRKKKLPRVLCALLRDTMEKGFQDAIHGSGCPSLHFLILLVEVMILSFLKIVPLLPCH